MVTEPRTAPPRAEAGRVLGDAPRCLLLSIPIAVLAITASVTAFLDDSIYARETSNWAAQATGQDIANLIVFPLMLVCARLAWRGSLQAFLIWCGLVTYSAYAFVIYSFAMHWGRLYLVDVAVLGLSVYALIGAISSIDHARVRAAFGLRAPVRATAVLMITLATVFYGLWLAIEVPAAIRGTPASELRETGLLTNPVHVLDLAIFLPAFAIVGVALWRRRAFAFTLAPMLLAAVTAITIGILSLMLVFSHRGLSSSAAGAVVNLLILALELTFLARLLRTIEPGTRLGDVLREAPRW